MRSPPAPGRSGIVAPERWHSVGHIRLAAWGIALRNSHALWGRCPHRPSLESDRCGHRSYTQLYEKNPSSRPNPPRVGGPAWCLPDGHNNGGIPKRELLSPGSFGLSTTARYGTLAYVVVAGVSSQVA